MYKYIACPDVLLKCGSISRNAKRPWDEHYLLGTRIAGSAAAYFACGDFWRNYTGTCFYSNTRLKQVPVNGVLVDAYWFLETKV